MSKHTNRLIAESSPYLLQHAHNPVDWFPWEEAAFEKARSENKLVLVSIGYSACHWCHVMERESFEDEEIAAMMNAHFVCIKVDREERPDVDQIYMSAVQLMTGSGGWPLNCFALPDGRPVYGGTYFSPEQWNKLLGVLHQGWLEESEKYREYATQLTEGVRESELMNTPGDDREISTEALHAMVEKWKPSFDLQHGGANRAPKFPLPVNLRFLLHYAHVTGDQVVEQHVKLTLQKMACGGIYDQIGGGFARYSVDGIWKLPHFEKMLYDNAQLISLYSKAHQVEGNPLYKQVVRQTAEWLEREMSAPDGGFYSALDADSEGEEGKFYVWSEAELRSIFAEDFDFVNDLYNHNHTGNWENDKIILLRNLSDEALMSRYNLTKAQLNDKVEWINRTLLTERSKRTRPGLDDKILTSWNALTISGYCAAYAAFGEERYLNQAQRTSTFLWQRQQTSDGGLFHTHKNGTASINGYLDDYAFVIAAFIDLYEVTFKEQWLHRANDLCAYVLKHFTQDETGLFYFTSDLDPPLIARLTETTDNVIPSSNSEMAKNLFRLGRMLFNKQYLLRSAQMLHSVFPMVALYGSSYANWAQRFMFQHYPFYEVLITGKEMRDFGKEFDAHYAENRVVLGAEVSSKIPLFENRFFAGQTTIFVCTNNTCQLPVYSVEEAISQMKTVR